MSSPKRAITPRWYRSFRWQVPARYNIGIDACDRWAETDPGRIAILNVRADGGIEEMSYGDAARDLEPACQRAGRSRHCPR